MKRVTQGSLLSVLAVALVLVGCSGKNGGSSDGGTAVPAVPPSISADPTDPKAGVKPSVVRGEVIYTLPFSFAFEKALRASNKNPAMFRAQLVNYKDVEKSLSWSMLELAVAAQGDAAANVTPFRILEARMKEFAGGQYGYVVSANITTQFETHSYPAQDIGGFLLSDQRLDLCSGPTYSNLCHFDNASSRNDFDIFAWIQ